MEQQVVLYLLQSRPNNDYRGGGGTDSVTSTFTHSARNNFSPDLNEQKVLHVSTSMRTACMEALRSTSVTAVIGHIDYQVVYCFQL